MDSKYQGGIYLVKRKDNNACFAGRRTQKKGAEEIDEDVQLLVAPPREKNENSSEDQPNAPVAGRTRGQKPSRQAHLRQAVGPGGDPVYVHVPFPASDLLNFKQTVGLYRENPEGMYGTIKTVMITQLFYSICLLRRRIEQLLKKLKTE